ncbi:MAG TPA: radical SAM protein [Vicinamibacterales bacterium]|nr:radical SAM protein [Vicinamibacterales bacterium]
MGPRFRSILVSVTEVCHVGCAHCGFIGAVRERESDPDELADWVDQTCAYGVGLIIFTGGESFERLECLVRGVAMAESHGTPAAVFTSSFWGTSLDAARSTLRQLPGLKHLYLSSDPYHQRNVPYQYVYNVIDAAIELGIPKITITITYSNDEEHAEVRSRYAQYGDRLRYGGGRVIPNPYFSKKVLLRQGPLRAPKASEYRCDCEIGTPIVNPNGDLFSCHTGKAAAHRDLRHLPYYLGNLREHSFADLMATAGARPDYQFLRTHGAHGVAALFEHEPGLIDAVGRDGFTTECDMCFSTLSTPAGRAALARHVARPEVRDAIDMRLALIGGEDPLP